MLSPSESPRHSFVVSDLHLADAEAEDPRRPLWRRYKLREHFPDASLRRFLAHARALSGGEPMELVLNGDIFDFDCVVATPNRVEARELGFSVGWLERARGLGAERAKSLWKMQRILSQHPEFIADLRDHVLAGNRLVYVIGNHDLEMHWPEVQQAFIDALDLPPDQDWDVRVCEWFYRSEGDTLITHGNQLDPYCLCHDPLRPFTEVRGKRRVRLPFGDLAGKYLSNGIGWFNPHVADTFVRSVWEWVTFFYKVIARQQPLILLTWLWSAMAALVVSLRDGTLPPVDDPLQFEDRLTRLAAKAQATAGMTLALQSVDAHPAVFRPWKVMRELWLDRAFLLALIGWGSFQVIAGLNLFAEISAWWIVLVLSVLLVPFFFYARAVDSDVSEVEAMIRARTPTLAAISRCRRVVMGHTHGARFDLLGPVEYLNTGHWAPGFHDLECTRRHGLRAFAWIRPDPSGPRKAELRDWQDPGSVALPASAVLPLPRSPAGMARQVGAKVRESVTGLRAEGAPRPADPGRG